MSKSFEIQKVNTMIDFMRTLSNSRQSLWHGINVPNAAKQLKEGVLLPYTHHRYWSDGVRRKETDPLYEDSFWMYGWSTTRKREYACAWATVVLEFDAQALAHQFEIMPIAWNNLFSHRRAYQKKEFEEFVIAHKDNKSITQLKNDDKQRDESLDVLYEARYKVEKGSEQYHQLTKEIEQLENQKNWFAYMNEPKGKGINLEKCLMSIYINETNLSFYLENNNKESLEEIQTIINHPKYKGTFPCPHEKKNKKSLNV